MLGLSNRLIDTFFFFFFVSDGLILFTIQKGIDITIPVTLYKTD